MPSLIPTLFFQRFLRQYRDFDFLGTIHLGDELNLVIVHLFIFNREQLTISSFGRHDKTLAVLAMTDTESSIRQERDFFLECLLVLRQCLLWISSQFLGIFLFLLLLLLLAKQLTPRLRTFKLFIYLLEERHMIVEFYQIERTVECQLAMSINGIAIGVAILIFHASLPRIVRTIRSIGIHPIENRQ